MPFDQFSHHNNQLQDENFIKDADFLNINGHVLSITGHDLYT